MANQDWEAERMFVLETVKRVEAETMKNTEAINNFKTDVTSALAVIHTKLAVYAVVGSAVVSIIVSYVSHIIKA